MLDESIGGLKETVSIEQSNNWSSGIFSKREAKSNACKEAVNGSLIIPIVPPVYINKI